MSSIDAAYIDYKQLLSALETDDTVTPGSIYEQIMTKEKNAIDLMNRIVEKEHTFALDGTILYNKTLLEVVMLVANGWRSMFSQIFVERSISGVPELLDVIFNGDRKIYTGILLVLIALVLFFVDIST
jgi:hypothetical protein